MALPEGLVAQRQQHRQAGRLNPSELRVDVLDLEVEDDAAGPAAAGERYVSCAPSRTARLTVSSSVDCRWTYQSLSNSGRKRKWRT